MLFESREDDLTSFLLLLLIDLMYIYMNTKLMTYEKNIRIVLKRLKLLSCRKITKNFRFVFNELSSVACIRDCRCRTYSVCLIVTLNDMRAYG